MSFNYGAGTLKKMSAIWCLMSDVLLSDVLGLTTDIWYPMTDVNVWGYMSDVLCLMLSIYDVLYLMSYVWHPKSYIWCPIFDIYVWCLMWDIWHKTPHFRPVTSEVWDQTSHTTQLISDVGHHTFDIRHLTYLRSAVWYQTSHISHFGIWNLPSDVWHQTFDIYQRSDVRCLMRDGRHVMCDICLMSDVCMICMMSDEMSDIKSEIRHLKLDNRCLTSDIWRMRSEVWHQTS